MDQGDDQSDENDENDAELEPGEKAEEGKDQNPEDQHDEINFASAFNVAGVSLELKSEDRVTWINPRLSSIRLCRRLN